MEMDGRPHLLEDRVTVQANGTFDLFTYTYDARGNQTSLTIDEGNDGSGEFVMVETYDANDRLIGRVRDGVATNANEITAVSDGDDDWVESWTWFDADRPLSHRIDRTNDGVDDVVAEWEWDPNGRRTLERVDGTYVGFDVQDSANGTWDLEMRWSYDAIGRELTYAVWDEEKGSLEDRLFLRATFEYGMCSDFLE